MRKASGLQMHTNIAVSSYVIPRCDGDDSISISNSVYYMLQEIVNVHLIDLYTHSQLNAAVNNQHNIVPSLKRTHRASISNSEHELEVSLEVPLPDILPPRG